MYVLRITLRFLPASASSLAAISFDIAPLACAGPGLPRARAKFGLSVDVRASVVGPEFEFLWYGGIRLVRMEYMGRPQRAVQFRLD